MAINVFEGARRIAKLIAVLWVIGVLALQFESLKNPYISANFQVDSPGNTPLRMDGQEYKCGDDDATESWLSKYTNKGTEVKVTLCFKARVVDDGRKLIPIRDDHVANAKRLAEWIGANHDKKGTTKYQEYEAAYNKAIKAKNELISDAKEARELGDPDLELAILRKLAVWGYEKYSPEVSSYTKKVADSFKLSKADEEWADSEVWSIRLENIKECLLIIFGGLIFIWLFSWIFGWIVRGFLSIPTGQDNKP
ncbi:MAG: hypothetical protein HOO93_03005 [Methyloglobulus sp.]|nr:hypothetical protein [Methyloglobulus sp.]